MYNMGIDSSGVRNTSISDLKGVKDRENSLAAILDSIMKRLTLKPALISELQDSHLKGNPGPWR